MQVIGTSSSTYLNDAMHAEKENAGLHWVTCINEAHYREITAEKS